MTSFDNNKVFFVVITRYSEYQSLCYIGRSANQQSSLILSILFYSILFYSILFYSILFYSILFYSILFCFILPNPAQKCQLTHRPMPNAPTRHNSPTLRLPPFTIFATSNYPNPYHPPFKTCTSTINPPPTSIIASVFRFFQGWEYYDLWRVSFK